MVEQELLSWTAQIFKNEGGSQPYLDPAGLQLQDRYVFSLVQRFHDVPFLARDLINEPSANENAWKTLPQHDPFEEAAWRKWLKQRYPDEASLLAAWGEPAFGAGRMLQSKPTDVPPEVAAADPFAMPTAGAFDFDGVRGEITHSRSITICFSRNRCSAIGCDINATRSTRSARTSSSLYDRMKAAFQVVSHRPSFHRR